MVGIAHGLLGDFFEAIWFYLATFTWKYLWRGLSGTFRWFGLKVYEPWSYMKKTGLRKVTDNMSLVPYDEVKEDMSEHLWRPKEEISF